MNTSDQEKRPAIFMDRDGTMTVEGGYINHPSRLELIEGTAEAVRRCNDEGVLAVVVTNQAGVARGYFTEDLIHVVHDRLRRLIDEAAGGRLDAVYYCPHHPREGPEKYRVDCGCRKPKPGMIEQACRELPVDMTRSYMVGDKISDIEFGRRLGLRTMMVMTGYGRGEHEYQRQDWTVQPDFVAENLLEAVNWAIQDLKARSGTAS